MKNALVILTLLCFGLGCKNTPQDANLQNGDLLFMDADCGNFCEAIEKVTQSYGGARFSHCALLKINGKDSIVIEAVSKGVKTTPLDSFMQKSVDAQGHSKVMVGRLKSPYQKLIPEALRFAETLIGKPYDDEFNINNDKYYCSELIYFSFKNANQGQEVFPLKPMTFKDPATGQTFPVWTKYYEDLGLPIPEGQPGLNPGGISLSDKIDIVKKYY